MATFCLQLRDDQCDHTVDIEAPSVEDAIAEARRIVAGEAKDWCEDGEWGDDGASISVTWSLVDEEDEELDGGSVTVEIEADHATLIRKAAGYADICGTDPEDHAWTSAGEGGLDDNPGVWSVGGTAMVFKSHCRKCGLHRTERSTGSQRNPGEHDTVEYDMLDSEQIARHRKNGDMDLDLDVDSLREEIADAVEASDVCCPEQVTDAVLAVAVAGGDWQAELAGAVERDSSERRSLGIGA